MNRPKHKKYHIIYKTTCLPSGKWYIGMHSTDDLNDGYQGSGTQLWFSIRKYGRNAHVTETLEFLPDRASLVVREKELVNEEIIKHEACMNLKIGGGDAEYRKPTPEESKLKNSIASKAMWAKRKAEGYVPPSQKPEHVAKRAVSNTGKKRSPEQIENLNRGRESYYAHVDKTVLVERAKKSHVTRKLNGSANGGRPKGIPMSEEQKTRQSEMMKGKPSGVTTRASCRYCKKETTIGAITQFHKGCNGQL